MEDHPFSVLRQLLESFFFSLFSLLLLSLEALKKYTKNKLKQKYFFSWADRRKWRSRCTNLSRCCSRCNPRSDFFFGWKYFHFSIHQVGYHDPGVFSFSLVSLNTLARSSSSSPYMFRPPSSSSTDSTGLPCCFVFMTTGR